MNTTARGQAAVVLVEVEVGKPVADVDATTERDDDLLACRVCSDVAADSSLGSTEKRVSLELVMCLCRVGLT